MTTLHRRHATMKKFIIEARVNEYTMREGNRHVPWTPEEIARAAAECRAAGASIVHFHVRKPDGAPEFGYEPFRETVARIRAVSDILVNPTLGAFDRLETAEGRLAHVLRLASEGLGPDFAPMDMGSTNADRIDPATGWFKTDQRVYTNSIATLKYFAARMRAAGVKPQLVNWNVPMLRTSGAFLNAGLIDAPAYLYLGLSAASLAHHPLTREGLAAFLPFLPAIPHEWTVATTGGSLLPFVEQIATAGGHISLGLGDHDYRELGEPSNAQVIERVASLARELGREPASPAETRVMLGITAHQDSNTDRA
jgi:3-keto-5-aminohexanoate cleavage enzyme